MKKSTIIASLLAGLYVFLLVGTIPSLAFFSMVVLGVANYETDMDVRPLIVGLSLFMAIINITALSIPDFVFWSIVCLIWGHSNA